MSIKSWEEELPKKTTIKPSKPEPKKKKGSVLPKSRLVPRPREPRRRTGRMTKKGDRSSRRRKNCRGKSTRGKSTSAWSRWRGSERGSSSWSSKDSNRYSSNSACRRRKNDSHRSGRRWNPQGTKAEEEHSLKKPKG